MATQPTRGTSGARRAGAREDGQGVNRFHAVEGGAAHHHRELLPFCSGRERLGRLAFTLPLQVHRQGGAAELLQP